MLSLQRGAFSQARASLESCFRISVFIFTRREPFQHYSTQNRINPADLKLLQENCGRESNLPKSAAAQRITLKHPCSQCQRDNHGPCQKPYPCCGQRGPNSLGWGWSFCCHCFLSYNQEVLLPPILQDSNTESKSNPAIPHQPNSGSS